MILYHGTNMDSRELNNQYFFGTEKAIKLLKRI